jgi:hypothetical protein
LFSILGELSKDLMRSHSALLNADYARIIILILLFVFSIYLFTYSGQIESGDTRTLFNAVGSLAKYGDRYLDQTAWMNLPDPTIPNQQYPLTTDETEPLQLILATLLYWLGEHLSGVGLVHIVWLFNIFAGMILCVVIFWYALTLQYQIKVAALAAISLGIGTIIWPYTKTFFREPLACLMILFAAFFVERWRLSRYRSFKWLLGSLVAIVGAFLSKEAVVFALPALLIIAMPSMADRWAIALAQLLLVLILGLVGLFVVLSCFPQLVDRTSLYNALGTLTPWSARQIETIHLALHSYLLSVGGSIWGTSPITLLTLPGLVMLYKRRQFRYFFLIISLVMCFAIGYAVLRGDHWFGGLSWPPRFLVPVIPFLIIGSLPVFDKLFELAGHRLLRIVGFAIVFAYSIWVQVSAVSLSWLLYPAALPSEAKGLLEWSGGLNVVQFLRWIVIPRLWANAKMDFAWVRTEVMAWPLICLVILFISTVLLLRAFHSSDTYYWNRRNISVYACLVFVPVILLWFGLRAIFHDNLYQGDKQALHDLMPILGSNSQRNDILLLASDEYEPFFLNYAKLNSPRVVTLPDAPGERPSPEQAPQVAAVNPDVLLIKHAIPLIHNLAKMRPRLWLLTDSGPWIPWSIRPVERFMETHYYPVREFSTDPRVRLIEYATINAPDPYAFRNPIISSDLCFGTLICLEGVYLPKGINYQRDDFLPLSWYWRADSKLEQDYTVAWFVTNSQSTIVAQGFDTQPQWGLAPTSSWEPGIPVWDNRALRLPNDIQAGEYQIWIRLYQADNSALQLPVTGHEVIDGTIGVLPVKIQIKS